MTLGRDRHDERLADRFWQDAAAGRGEPLPYNGVFGRRFRARAFFGSTFRVVEFL